MITGFLFTTKLLRASGPVDWWRLYRSRVFRIFPLYLLVVGVISLLVFHNSSYRLNVPWSTLLQQYAHWLMFHGGLINDYPYTRVVIASVDWTLKYEWLFYLALPLLHLSLVRGGRIVAFALLVASILLFARPVGLGSFTSLFFLLFTVGAGVAWLQHGSTTGRDLARSNLSSMISLAAIVAALLQPVPLGITQVALMSVFFGLTALGNDLFGLFRTPASRLLGEISYSIYLTHGIVLFMLFTQWRIIDPGETGPLERVALVALVAAITTSGSMLTYLLIERPAIHFGRGKSPRTSPARPDSQSPASTRHAGQN